MDYLKRAKSFRTKKRLGQNFLICGDTIQAILDNANITKEDTVIEIGAGVGFVTEQLVKHAKHVIAIELDEDAIKELRKIKCDNLEIIHQDILKTDLSTLVSEKASRAGLLSRQQKVKIVANIPYYITSPIVAHLLGEIDDLNNKNRNLISEIILMVQWEVAQRIVATDKSPSKQYGLLTILSQFWADCEIIKKVGKKCFYPSPKVDSALVKLTVREKPLLNLTDYSHFRKTIKAAFSQRRKNIKNCLFSGGFSKENITKVLENLGITENTRGETISIEKFGELSEGLSGATRPLRLCRAKHPMDVSGEVRENFHREERVLENWVRGQIKVKCPAKINLTLEVLGKRPDGFHNIQSVMQTIDLFDILTIKVEKNDKCEIKLSGTSNEIPYDERNLVYKAILLFVERTNLEPYRILVNIKKNIPVAAGLAGGSTDAAGTLWGLNKLFNNVLSEKELHELCAKLGSDLNFCLEGGCCLATGRGEILESLTFQEFRLSLIKPKKIGISAKEAYKKFSELKIKPDLNMTQKLIRATNEKDIKDFLHNDLEIAVINYYSELQEIKKAYPRAIMSGSGSTFFVLEENIKQINNDFWIKTGLKTIPYGVCEK